MMNNRCMHELQTVDVDKVAEEIDDDASKSICVTELG